MKFKSGCVMIFDIYVPVFKLVLEYQGFQHYYDHFIHGKTIDYAKRDEEKRQVCHALGITLIEVPYWWQRDKESIIAIIHNSRPDLIPHSVMTTPFVYPGKHKKELVAINV